MSELRDKYFWKFKKETCHLGGSVPFWDWTFSANLKATKGEKLVYFNAGDLIDLKKILKDFDGRNGTWKRRNQKQNENLFLR